MPAGPLFGGGLFGGGLFGAGLFDQGDPMSAVIERLARDIATVVHATGVPGRTVVRRRPAVLDAATDFPTAGKPLAVVSAQRGRSELLYALPAPAVGKVMQTYTVVVSLAVPAAMLLSPTTTLHEWVEDVRQAVHGTTTFPNTPEWNETRPAPQVFFDAGSLDKNFAWAVCVFEVECIESRS